MVERTRTTKISVEIDTNKRTIERTFQHHSDYIMWVLENEYITPEELEGLIDDWSEE